MFVGLIFLKRHRHSHYAWLQMGAQGILHVSAAEADTDFPQDETDRTYRLGDLHWQERLSCQVSEILGQDLSALFMCVEASLCELLRSGGASGTSGAEKREAHSAFVTDFNTHAPNGVVAEFVDI